MTGQQFAWTGWRRAEGRAATAGAPTSRSGHAAAAGGRQVELRLEALDVIHSFWVPEFRQKQDAVPGIVTAVAVTPTKPGEHTVVCTELCGLGHALMRAPVIVMTEDEFDRWRAGAGASSQGGQG